MNAIETCGDEDCTDVVLLVANEQTVTERYAEWVTPKYSTRIANSGRGALNAIGDDTVVVVLACDIADIDPREFLDRARTVGYDGRVVLVAESQSNANASESDFDGFLVKPVAKSTFLETVDTLARRVRYRNRLDHHLSLAVERARRETRGQAKEPEASARHVDFVEELAELDAELDRIVADFETEDFHAVLREVLS